MLAKVNICDEICDEFTHLLIDSQWNHYHKALQINMMCIFLTLLTYKFIIHSLYYLMTTNMKRIFKLLTVGVLALLSLPASAANVDVAGARSNANQFIKSHRNIKALQTAATADLKLAYTQPSRVAPQANAYYAFNIVGGGFVIVAGEDRAAPVLGFSDQGHLDFNNLPENVQALLRCYQEEIEYLQSHPSLSMAPAVQADMGNGVAPLIKSHWGQEMPYCLQCPIYQGEYCVVGCVATAMTQVMHYWQYPTSSPEINSYYCYDIGQTLQALPETSFEYAKMLNSYCHWDWDQSALIQDTYTDEQAQAVAKLARYCGQAVKMGYSPDGSGAYVDDQLAAMKLFGYNNNARQVSRSGWFGFEYYTTAEWLAMVKTELDAGRPILYSATDPAAGGHAFVCDGYNSEGLLHFNFGWYGTCDGWFVSTALNMTHRDGDELHFNSGHEMLLDVEPPSYCVISADNISVQDDLLVLGEDMSIKASGVNIRTTNPQINLLFSICNDSGRRLANSETLNVTLDGYQQGSDLTSVMRIPTSLGEGNYQLVFFYYITMPRVPTTINCDCGELNVVGHLAKYNKPFSIGDVTMTIQYLLDGSHPILTIDDVTTLINHLLQQ